MLLQWLRNFRQKRSIEKLKDKQFRFLFDNDNSDEIVVFDTETTGLNPKKDEIISIGAVKVKNNKILTSQIFELLVKTDAVLDAKNVEIHGIRPVDLHDGRSIDEAIVEFLEFIGSRTLVGYYLEFDIAMINKYVKPMLGIKLPNKQLEVSEIYYNQKIQFIPQGNIDLRFDTILKDLKLPNMGAHNAVNDAIMTAMIYLKLTKGNENVKTDI